MDAEANTEYLRSQVLQNTLQQISSPTATKDTTCCVICLGDLVEQCEAQPCQHNNFDYFCLITWLEQRATCPLCNSDVTEVRYDLDEDGKQGKVYKLPEQSGKPRKSNGQIDENLSGLYSGRLRREQPCEDEAIRKRRFVYRHNLYSLHVGCNRRQPAALRQRELSPELFMTDSGLISRARMWLRRELRVFEFLNDDNGSPQDHDPIHRHRSSRAEFLLEYILAILKVVDIQGSAGQAEIMIQEFLGRDYTKLFLHELRAWLRSPCESLGTWDRIVQYGSGIAMP